LTSLGFLAGIAHHWTADPIPADPYANAWAIGKGVEIFERSDDDGVIRPASPESLKVLEQEEGEGELIPCFKSSDPKSPFKGRPLEPLELERRSPGGSDKDERPVLTRAASKNLRRRNADSAKLRTSYRARGRLGGKRLDDRISASGLWPIERNPDGTPVLARNTHLVVLHDIGDAQACLARPTPVLPALLTMVALSTYGLTQAQCQAAFKPGKPSQHRLALRERVREMLRYLHDECGVTVISLANFLCVDRRRINDLVSKAPKMGTSERTRTPAY
jgi:hypothetical protein